MTRALIREEERQHAAFLVTAWLLQNPAADHPTGTNFIPVAIDEETRVVYAIAQEPGAGASSETLERIPMLAVA
jgi:hypothetical protein